MRGAEEKYCFCAGALAGEGGEEDLGTFSPLLSYSDVQLKLSPPMALKPVDLTPSVPPHYQLHIKNS